jgi:hypothetical protein
MAPVRAPVVTGPGPDKRSSDEAEAAGDDPRSCFLVTGAGSLRLGQDLACSAIRAGVALLLSHRNHEPVLRASDGSRIEAVPASTGANAAAKPLDNACPERTAVECRAPAHGPQRTVLDYLPIPTDKKVVPAACLMRR